MKKVFWLIIPCLLLTGCKFSIGFNPGPQDDNLKTLNIQAFGNNATLVVPYLAQEFTEELQDRFLSRSRLTFTDGEADVVISGAITRYTINPVAISGGETAAQNRLTITVNVKYENAVTPNDSWEQTFTNYSDFSSNLNFASEERGLIEEIVDLLAQDIFNQALGKW